MNMKIQRSIDHLRKKKKVLFLTTSNRWAGSKELPKSTELAKRMAQESGNVELIDVSKLKINPCEANVSVRTGNECGVKGALLKDATRNPSGLHSCWVSFNDPGDELWKVTKPLFEADCVVFFASVRWGQTNSIHQRLIERLTWIENRHTTLGGENIVSGTDAGIILIGHNWRAEEVLKTQVEVLRFFGFNVVPDLCLSWQFTNPEDEAAESYLAAPKMFDEEFLI
jgi:multimeric flavodoxin WrbA